MLNIQNISKELGEFSLRSINLTINKGDYYVILGKSGAGKTILLEIIAGLIPPDSGCIHLNGTEITRSRIQDRKVGIVFQDYALFPHMTVQQNVEYGLKHGNTPREAHADLLKYYSGMTEITHLLPRNVQNLSGGELQRVAIARTLIKQPSCLLLDEPLSSLDVQLRGGVRKILRQINQSGVTVLHVTHDYEEAIALSNKVAVLNQGEIIQNGITRDVFRNPKNEFVANFTGIKNYFAASFSGNKALIDNNIIVSVVNTNNLKQGKIIIQGNHIIVSPHKLDSSSVNNYLGIVRQVLPQHGYVELIADIGVEVSVLVSEESFRKYNYQMDSEVWISFKANAVRLIA